MSTTTENNYVSNGSTVLYSFTFPYINEADVKVSLNQLDTTAFTLANATTVELDEAPVSGVSIRIYRSTPTDAISAEFFPGSAIRAQDLNANFEQSLYVVQESQTIIENSDAAAVVGIANEALSTANQAKNTADSVSGTANDAVTTANEADTTANQALSDAATAQATAVAARTVADAALNSGSVLSDLSDVSTTPAITNQVLGWSGSTWGPVNQTGGGGGGGTTINYNGASAWGYVNAGSLINGLNVDSSISNPATGVFDVSFTTAMPDANYSVVVTAGLEVVGNACNCSVGSKTVNGFQVNINKVSDNQGTNQSFQFAVFATNSLPPQGTTGTDSFGAVEKTTVNGPCVVSASYNVASVSRISEGYYQVTFTTPMPTADYSVTISPEVASPSNTAADYASITPSEKTANGFRVLARFQNYDNGGTRTLDSAFNFAVNCTNANLPLTVTQEQIESAINNPGASAWGSVAADGTLNGGMNVASVTESATGEFDVVFTTAMPSGNYSVVANSVNRSVGVDAGSQSATGFTLVVQQVSTGANASIAPGYTLDFQVFATNGLPPTGGTGTDAWASVDSTTSNGPCNVPSSFNIASVTRTGTGVYDVVFTTPAPTSDYCVITNSSNSYATTAAYNYTSTGFSVGIRSTANNNNLTDSSFNFTVNATNATLPSTFTVAQFNDLVARVTALENA